MQEKLQPQFRATKTHVKANWLTYVIKAAFYCTYKTQWSKNRTTNVSVILLKSQ